MFTVNIEKKNNFSSSHPLATSYTLPAWAKSHPPDIHGPQPRSGRAALGPDTRQFRSKNGWSWSVFYCDLFVEQVKIPRNGILAGLLPTQ